MLMKIMRNIFMFLCVLALFACSEEAPSIPRPRGYPRIELPKGYAHKVFSNTTCPCEFEYPDFGTITLDKPDSCWVDISFPQFGAKWHVTFKDAIATRTSRGEHFELYRKMIYKHIKKASEIRELPYQNDSGYGTIFELTGNVGTPQEIFFGDSTRVMMIAFYYSRADQNDSLQPVTQMMKSELMHMLETFKWTR